MNEIDTDNQEVEEEILTEETQQFLSFIIEGEFFGLELLSVHEILKPVPITRIPNVEDYIMGVINLRGEIIPIIDLKKRFDISFTELQPSSRFVVVMKDDKRFGLLVDEVRQVVKITESNINYTTDDLALSYGKLIESVSRINDHLILNLGINQLVEFVQDN
ncbi:chemotaxis protein CheW [Leptospira sp. GIMC2001]|uniref:chemotaxis protein CheW n=1 Tax=Leptospira sp. GIMC2001 TaxID=1513297 RepID=UPI00234AB47D|nr:chemotaxis protein CheW [Leptospira sp. GIMC2001]WCL48904.1 chemotaxis protein CheW [Leptospira sp. GIMC2001]